MKKKQNDGEIPMYPEYPQLLTFDQSDEFELWRAFHSITKAYDWAIKTGGQFYTQVDGDDGERIYDKGNHMVNRTGVWLVVKTTGDKKKDSALYITEGWEVPKDFGDSGLDQEEEEDYRYRKQHGSELR